jgi:hypothetical protein
MLFFAVFAAPTPAAKKLGVVFGFGSPLSTCSFGDTFL